MPLDRRRFIGAVSATSAGSIAVRHSPFLKAAVLGDSSTHDWPDALPEDDLVSYLARVSRVWDDRLYKHLLGAANPFKEGDSIVGVAAKNDRHRELARQVLANTALHIVDAHPPLEDDLFRALRGSLDAAAHQRTADWTFDQLKLFLLEQDEREIQAVTTGLSSDVIGCVVKLLSDAELIAVGGKLFNPLPGSQIGARGYLSARIQPNSPTDHPDDIRWQVFNAWAFAVGDLLLGTNPVSSEAESVAQVERCLQDILRTFGLADVLPHCVLAHIDVQAQVEHDHPGTTALWFQSIAGSDSANATFDISLEKMLRYASIKAGPFGLYFETGQGADFTNGHGHGYDMVLHESRKYGLARLLSQQFAKANGLQRRPWVHVNDVAGFIGPEVFRTREQLVRCCLEDIVMGKLHGLCIGLDVCSTLHMDISLDDLDWCQQQLVPACPAYLMALPTKIDPMLGYLTTAYQDHVRLREKFGCRVDDRMWGFFKRLKVIDDQGRPTEHFGDPLWVYRQYCRHRNDQRSDHEIQADGRQQMRQIRERGVFLAVGHGQQPSDLQPQLAHEINRIYDDSKRSLRAEFDAEFRAHYHDAVWLETHSEDREDFILHPATGEQLSALSLAKLGELREHQAGQYNVQIVVSDGLNALALNDRQQLEPFLESLQHQLNSAGYQVSPQLIVVERGRVRAGYQIGHELLGGLGGRRAILHVIGERPGTGHRTFSVYFSCPEGSVWASSGLVDHDRTRVVAGIANTALHPQRAAEDVLRILGQMWNQP
ncbi:MAG: ethanolamine ammonia-lyase subunit EutB [Pirellulaceae bacterium]|nr:ethanolamine ammonia-lyase subunit EutB [Pirellulaceae bacterium]